MKFEINHHYTNDQIHDRFGGSKYSGMRHAKNGKELALISKLYNNIYPDQLKGNVLYYTGMGQTGDQSIDYAQNKTLNNAAKLGIHVYLFFNVNSNDYIYAGPVKLSGTPEYEKDQTGRYVVKFPLITSNSAHVGQVNHTYKKSMNYSASQLSTRQLEKRVHKNEKKGKKLVNHRYKTVSHQYVRNVNVAELARRFAKGTCQLCGKKMFIRKDNGEPYLESHHINWLMHSGADSIKNVIALCPNCHKFMHYGRNTKDAVKKLQARSLQLAKEHGFN